MTIEPVQVQVKHLKFGDNLEGERLRPPGLPRTSATRRNINRNSIADVYVFDIDASAVRERFARSRWKRFARMREMTR